MGRAVIKPGRIIFELDGVPEDPWPGKPFAWRQHEAALSVPASLSRGEQCYEIQGWIS